MSTPDTRAERTTYGIHATSWEPRTIYERVVECVNPDCDYMAVERWDRDSGYGLCTKCGFKWNVGADHRPTETEEV